MTSRRLACCDHSFPALQHELVLDLISMLGFGACDLMLHGGRFHLRPEIVRTDVAGWAARIDERVRGRGLEISDLFLIPWAGFKTMAPNHPDEAERQRARALFRDVLALAARVQVDGITTLPGIDWPGETHDDSLARAAVEFKQRISEAQELGIRLSVEPHVGSVCEDPSDAARLCELSPGLELTLDYSHPVSLGLAQSASDDLLRFTRHFHARGAAPNRLQAPMKESTIDFERIVDLMAVHGYSGYLSVEYLAPEDELDDVDVASETVLMRDRLGARLAGHASTYSPTTSSADDALLP